MNQEQFTCPKCHCPECWRDSVHNGIAMLYGPWGCPECGWSEDSEFDVSNGPKITDDGYRLDQFGGATPIPKTMKPFKRSDTEKSGGYIWCDMCGYNATLTEEQVCFLKHSHDVWCDDCSEEEMNSILCWGRDLPDHIIPDEPMKAHKEKKSGNK